VAAVSYANEWQFAFRARLPQPSLNGFAGKLRNRNPPPVGFALQGIGHFIWQTDCCASHTRILAHEALLDGGDGHRE